MGELRLRRPGLLEGGSIAHCVSQFGVERGLGIGVNSQKVEKTRAAGFNSITADARDLRLEGQVSFVAMLDFFEHLPDLGVVQEVLAAAARSARDFIFIKHSSFDVRP